MLEEAGVAIHVAPVVESRANGAILEPAARRQLEERGMSTLATPTREQVESAGPLDPPASSRCRPSAANGRTAARPRARAQAWSSTSRRGIAI